MTRFRVVWRSTRTGRSYQAATTYATLAQAQANCDFCSLRYGDLGLVYTVQAEADEPATEPANAAEGSSQP